MDMQPVDSEMITEVGYDPNIRLLVVRFNNGKAYNYYDVPQGDYEGLMAAASKGRYMRQSIIGVYRESPHNG